MQRQMNRELRTAWKSCRRQDRAENGDDADRVHVAFERQHM
jgi:hypothetical protein